MAKKKSKKDKDGLIVTYEKDRECILKNESWVYTDSLNLAEVMQTEHKEVLKKIRKILSDYKISTREETPPVDNIQEYIYKNTDFTYSINYYKDAKGEMRPYYKLSKDLLVLVMFSFKTDRAKEFHKLYIAKFNAMEKELNWYKARYLGIVTRNYMTDCIRDYYDISGSKENPYVAFTNLVYKTLYGYDACKIRALHNLPKGENIRPWLSDEEVKVVDKMEQEIGTLISYKLSLNKIRAMINEKYNDKPKRSLKLLENKRK